MYFFFLRVCLLNWTTESIFLSTKLKNKKTGDCHENIFSVVNLPFITFVGYNLSPGKNQNMASGFDFPFINKRGIF